MSRVVCPYNSQVADMARHLPGGRVGTVDTFQGQEAPVVNVATSRARGVCVLVANPLLLEVDCHTPRQMQLANAFCRYLELAHRLG